MPTSSGALDAFAGSMECSARLSGTPGKQLLLARDPFGMNRSTTGTMGHRLCLRRSSCPLLVTPNVRRTVDVRGLYEFMSVTFVPTPLTAFDGISKLPPGHLLVCDDSDTVGAVPIVKALSGRARRATSLRLREAIVGRSSDTWWRMFPLG